MLNQNSRRDGPTVLRWLAVVVIFTAVLAPLNAGLAAQAPSAQSEHSLERLYRQPNLIGTAPGGVVWSPSSRYFAFLWNEVGEAFRDVYLIDTEDPELVPQRLTRMPGREATAPEPSFFDDPAVERIVLEERRRLDRGVSAVTFLTGRRGPEPAEGPVVVFGFRGDLYTVEPGSAPRQLTETTEPERSAAASPDGQWLAFMRAGALYVASLAVDPHPSGGPASSGTVSLGEVHRVAPPEQADEAKSVVDFRWSPDSRRLSVVELDQTGVAVRDIPDYLTVETSADRVRRAYPGEEAGRSRLGVVEVGSVSEPMAPPGPLTFIDLGQEGEVGYLHSHRWSPGGRYFAVDTSDLYVKHRRILRVEAASGLTEVWLEEENPNAVSPYFWRIEWADDGSGLYVISDFLGPGEGLERAVSDYHLFFADFEGTVRQITQGDFAVAEVQPRPGGALVVANRDAAEERRLFWLSAESSQPELLPRSERQGTHQPWASPDGRFAAVHFSSDSVPPDLFLTTLDPDQHLEERRVTRSPIREFENYRWQTPRYVTFESRVDGATLNGRLTLPPDYDPGRKYPAILGSVYTDAVRNQWGGRTAHPTWGLDQYLTQEGYVLLNVDMRGSWGRGRVFREGIRLAYGGPDVEDLASAVDFLATLGFVDMERVGIWGSSYGGLMTCMSLFRHPELYAAGFAGAPATNVWHALTGQMAVMMDPADEKEAYAASSPYLHAAGLEDPLMVLHGMRDRVVLFKDSVRLVHHLIQLEKDVELVAMPDAYHGWDLEPNAQTRFAFRKLVDFFDRHLRPGEREEAP